MHGYMYKTTYYIIHSSGVRKQPRRIFIDVLRTILADQEHNVIIEIEHHAPLF